MRYISNKWKNYATLVWGVESEAVATWRSSSSSACRTGRVRRSQYLCKIRFALLMWVGVRKFASSRINKKTFPLRNLLLAKIFVVRSFVRIPRAFGFMRPKLHSTPLHSSVCVGFGCMLA